jgi:hypothetical protein
MKKQLPNAYTQMIIYGRALEAGLLDYKPGELIALVDHWEEKLRWTPVKGFFQLFPPIKRYNEPDVWDYNSTTEMIENELGERFGKDDLKDLLMTHCYENEYLQSIGVHYLKAISDLRKKKTGISLASEFLLYHT